MGDLTFSDYQKQVDDWIRTHGVRAKKTKRDHQRHRRNPKLSRLDDAGEKTGSDSGAGLETSAPRGGDHEKNG
jgi:hypothetical protein